MSEQPSRDRFERTHEALAHAVEDLRVRLQAKISSGVSGDAASIPEGSPLGRVIRKFHLSPFERDVLVLAAGVELDSTLARLIADFHRDASKSQPTFSLALTLLDRPHWSAISPEAALRRGRLIKLGDGPCLVEAPIIIEEPVLHMLNGVAALDQRLRPFISPRIARAWHPASSRRSRASRMSGVHRPSMPFGRKCCSQLAIMLPPPACSVRRADCSISELTKSTSPRSRPIERNSKTWWSCGSAMPSSMTARCSSTRPPPKRRSAAASSPGCSIGSPASSSLRETDRGRSVMRSASLRRRSHRTIAFSSGVRRLVPSPVRSTDSWKL